MVSSGKLWWKVEENGAQYTGKKVDDTAFFANFHNAQPQGEHTGQSQGNLECRFRRTERAIDDFGEYFYVAQKDQTEQSDGKGYQEKGYPNIVEYHCV